VSQLHVAAVLHSL